MMAPERYRSPSKPPTPAGSQIGCSTMVLTGGSSTNEFDSARREMAQSGGCRLSHFSSGRIEFDSLRLDQIDEFRFPISLLAASNSILPDEKWLKLQPRQAFGAGAAEPIQVLCRDRHLCLPRVTLNPNPVSPKILTLNPKP